MSDKVKHPVFWTVFLSIVSLAWVYPIVLVLINSFKQKAYISRNAFSLPTGKAFVGLENYIRGIERTNLISSFGWTVVITVGAVLLIIVCTSMCAWWIVRTNNWAARLLYTLFLFNMIVPFQMVMFTLSKLADMMGLNTPWGLWIVYLGFGAGLAVFIFTGVVKGIPALSEGPLRFEEVMRNYKMVLTEIARVYNEAMNIIHYMHDKYYYEKAQMAFVDTDPRINLAYGVAGLSIALDSLSAIKYAKVTTRRNAEGLTEAFDIEGEFPCFGNNDDRVDHLGVDLVYFFSEELKKLPVYKNARPTLSLLTITSNVMYGKKTGATPDGRAKGVAFAPGANPMHGRDKSGAIASLASVAKLRYRDSQDGISNTFSIVPKSLGPTEEERIENLVTMLDGYFTKGAHHLNVNVLNRAMLEDAMEHPENYPQLTIRVSGYAVNFTRLSREHQLEVISRSFHERM